MAKWINQFHPRDQVWRERIQRAQKLIPTQPPRPKPALSLGSRVREQREFIQEYYGQFFDDPKVQEQRELLNAGKRRFKLGELSDVEQEVVRFTEEWKEKYVTSDRRLRAMEVSDRLCPPKPSFFMGMDMGLSPGAAVSVNANGDIVPWGRGMVQAGIVQAVTKHIDKPDEVQVLLNKPANYISMSFKLPNLIDSARDEDAGRKSSSSAPVL